MVFSHRQRLITKAEFNYVFEKPLKISQKHLTLLYKPNQVAFARIGVIVGKRVVNNAVARNRIRRIVRESFRFHQEKLTGWDIVIIARQQCDTLTKEKIREGIDYLWEKLLKHSQNCSLS